MASYERILLKAEKGITFSVSTRGSEELIINAYKIPGNVYSMLPSVSAGEYAEELSVYTDNDGNKAVIPQGWTVSGAAKENTIWGRDMGLVIYHIPRLKVDGIKWKNSDTLDTLMRTYDQFVWTPVEFLVADATIDGIHFNERFGRMKAPNDILPECPEIGYYEPLIGGLLLQKESVEKYGGYYTSRYKISEDEQTRKPRSVKGVYPWTSIGFRSAQDIAATMIEGERVKSHLLYGAEYDTRLKYAIETRTVTREEVEKDSTLLGNYRNNSDYCGKMVRTGEDGSINNIYGFAGNVAEWTQEQHHDWSRAVRNGSYANKGSTTPVDFRYHYDEYDKAGYQEVGFRVAICIE